MNKIITVFTPTYNRAYILPKLYDSLCEQDSQNFLWLIIDDGSSDNTSDLVNLWINEKKIDIRYIYQENAGKTRAHNKAVMLCNTELFVCIDSDDYLASSTVIKDTINFWKENKGKATNNNISGIVSYREMRNGPQGVFPNNLSITTLTELYEKGFQGETTLVFISEILKNNLFPEIAGEKFLTEAWLYDRLDINYKMLVFPYYSQVCEYQPDGITKNGWTYLFHNPKYYRLYYNQLLKFKKGNTRHNTQMYIACSLIANDGQTLSMSNSKLYTLLYFPFGALQYLKFRLRKW